MGPRLVDQLSPIPIRFMLSLLPGAGRFWFYRRAASARIHHELPPRFDSIRLLARCPRRI